MGAIGEIKEIGKFLQKVGNIELYEKLLAVQEKTLETMEKNINLQKENEKLKEKLRLKKSMEFENRAYWIKNKEGNVKDGPFCPHCWNTESLQMRLIESTIHPYIKRCSKCNYFTKGKKGES